METIDYQKQAQDLLDKFGVKFETVLVGNDCPSFCEDNKRAVYMHEVDSYPRRTHIHGKHYRCTFTKRAPANDLANRMDPAYHGSVSVRLVLDFWNSYRDEEFNAWAFDKSKLAIPADYPYWDYYAKQRKDRKLSTITGQSIFYWKRRVPTPYSVITCMVKNDPGGFEDWCSDLGYSSDSREAERVYLACCEEWRKVRAFFTAEELEELQEVQ